MHAVVKYNGIQMSLCLRIFRDIDTGKQETRLLTSNYYILQLIYQNISI